MIYLDNASTTKVRKEVLDTYVKVLSSYYGNSDSLHDLGRETSKLMEQSRAQIAQLLSVKSDEIFFTSCASESNNWAIKGYAWKNQHRGKHLITSSIEHASVEASMRQLEEEFGFEVTYLPVNEDGIVSLEDVKKAIRQDTILISLMKVNNETGAIQPVEEIADYVHKNTRIAIHCDCVQAIGKVDVDFRKFDMATFSAHKLQGLKGSSVLYKKNTIQLLPLISGGQQEQGIRAGTSNFPVNVVMAKTLRLALEDKSKYAPHVSELHKYLWDELSQIEDIVINSTFNGSPYIINLSCLRLGSEIMLNALNTKGFAVSAQSTCASHSKAISHVLMEMGCGELRATHAIRISICNTTTKTECEAFIKALKEIIKAYGTK